MDTLETFLRDHQDLFFVIEYIDGFKITVRKRLYGGSVNYDFSSNQKLEDAIAEVIERYGKPIENP